MSLENTSKWIAKCVKELCNTLLKNVLIKGL